MTSLLADEIGAVFAGKKVSEWLDLLRASGVSAVRNDDIEHILADGYPRERGLIVEEESPLLGRVTHAGVTPRLSETQPLLGTAPVFGEETEAVLLELGYEVEEIDALRANEVIHRWSSGN